jgi:hypothetical protein
LLKDINFKEEYKQFLEKIEKSGGLIQSKMLILDQEIKVYNRTPLIKEENWTENSLFLLYILYKYFTTINDLKKFLEKYDESEFKEAISLFNFDNLILNSLKNKLRKTAFAFLKELSDTPDKFILESIEYTPYTNEEWHSSSPTLNEELLYIIFNSVSTETKDSIKMYIRMKYNIDIDIYVPVESEDNDDI